MTTIRKATLNDIPRMVELGKLMHSEAPHYVTFPYHDDKVANLAAGYIGMKDGIVLVAEQDGQVIGMIVGGIADHYFGPSKHSYEICTFVHPDFRKSKAGWMLITKYTAAAIEMGADEVLIVNSTGVEQERVGKLFERAGFHKYGGVYALNPREE